MMRSPLNDTLGSDIGIGESGSNNGSSALDNDGSPGRRVASSSPSKARSLSDDGGPPALSPSPKFPRPEKRKSKDDGALDSSPTTPRRPAFQRGLSLQVPPARDLMCPNSATTYRVPLSPKLDHSQTYGSPTSVLPRRSRGLQYSRAATHLHNSMLAESSPDSSPTITGRAMNIPNGKNGLHFAGALDSNNTNSSSLWSTMVNADRVTVSSSVGSVNMMMSESSSNSSDEDVLMDADDIDDSILTNPEVNKMDGQFGGAPQCGPGGQSSSKNSLMNFARLRTQKGKSRKSSSRGSSNSMVSPSSKSPPTMRNIDINNGYFGREMTLEAMQARRESISWTANQPQISGSESDDGTLKSTLENADSMPVTPGRDSQRGVIRRAVTRRGNMLPKTKGFARIRAALAEESAPVETEVRREAEVVRLTRESDMKTEPRHPPASNTTTTHSSPTMGPTTQDSLEGIPEDEVMTDLFQGLPSSFKQHAMKNSKGKGFWESFKDDSNRTPPTPPQFPPRCSSSGISDISLNSPSLTTPPPFPNTSNISDHAPSSPSTPQPQTGPTREEITRKVNKRRRDDDFDPSSFKRRAVSPGMSVHNSPIMQSPLQRDLQPWGSRPPSSRRPSNGDGKLGTNGGLKRVGFQAMLDTNDGLMKMSIE